MPRLLDLPDHAPLGSIHLLQTETGDSCIARYTEGGWTVYLASGVEPITADALRRDGYKLVRSLLEGRRILSGD